MQLLKSLVVATIVIATSAVQAAAAPILTGLGSTFTVGMNGSTGDVTKTVDSFLSATVTFTVTKWSGKGATILVDVTNTSSTAKGYASRITALGFDMSPDVTGATVSGAFERTVSNDTMHAHGLPRVLDGSTDLCLKNGKSKGCESGKDGIEQGKMGSSTLTLAFKTLPASLVFSDFFVRYQGIQVPGGDGDREGDHDGEDDGGQLSGAGIATCFDGGCANGDKSVPEPTSLALLGAGLFGAGYARRRNQR